MSIISVDHLVVDEASGLAIFTVWLDVPDALPVTVDYSTLDISASSGSDYLAVSGTLTFAPGETVKTISVPILNDGTVEALESFMLFLTNASANATIGGGNFPIATIVDNDMATGTPVVTISDVVVDEAGKTATFTVSLNKPSTSLVSMNYATQNGTAVAGADFVAMNGALNFLPGEMAKTVKVTLLNDSAGEGSEAFNLVLSGVANATVFDSVGTATIMENDATSVSISTISVDDVIVDETQGFVDFLVRLDAPNVSPVTVIYSALDLSATYLDFTPRSAGLTFGPGEMVKTVRIPIHNDAEIEALESIRLELFSPSANARIANSSAIASIVDNDAVPGVPVVSIGDVVVDEASREVTFVITLNKPSTSVVSMNYATQNNTALTGLDFTAVSGTLNFLPGETVKTVKVTLLNDTAFETSEAFNLVLSNLTNATTLIPIGTATLAENDATKVGTSIISVDDVVVDESQAFADFLVRLDAPNLTPVIVDYITSDLFPGDGNGWDYIARSGTVTFASGEMLKTVRIPLLNDVDIETRESFTLTLSSAVFNTMIANNVAVATIVDNDEAPGVPVVSIDDCVVDEVGKEATFIITLDKPSTSVVSMNYATQNGTAVTGTDFLAASGTLTFAPGETAKTVKVMLVNDTTFENSETFNLVLSGITNATASDLIGTVIITENDAAAAALGGYKFSVDDIVVSESQGFADFLVRLDTPNLYGGGVLYQTFNLSAVYSDFTPLSGIVTFAPGEMVKIVRIPLLDDFDIEALESFTLVLTTAGIPPDNTIFSDNVAVATIVDNDTAPGVPLVSINDCVVDEVGKEATFVITVNKPSTSIVSMNYTTQNGTAVAGSDFTPVSGTLAFLPGQMVQTIKVPLLNDTVFEQAEAFNLVLSGVINASMLDSIGTVSIAENDLTAVAVSHISVDDIIVDESHGFAEFLVCLDAPNLNSVAVSYSASNLSAATGLDFHALSGPLTFAPGEMVKTVRIPLSNDTTMETPESFKLQLLDTSPSPYAAIADSIAMATITDNDRPAGIPSASLTDLVVDEANKTVTVAVVLDRPSAGAVSFTVSSQDVTATTNSDIRALTALGTLAFAPGETAKTVTFGLLNDTTSEGAEIFDVVLSNPVGATIADARAHVTIVANDAPAIVMPVLNVADVADPEQKGYVDFVVTLSAPCTSPVSVDFNSGGGSARGGVDYYDVSGTLRFASGEVAKTVRIALRDDALAESKETFFLNLSNATNATIGKGAATVWIIDNESAAPSTPIFLSGSDGDDILKGTSFADTLDGGNGNDLLDGDAGNDSYSGGAGNDIYLLEEVGDSYTEVLNAGTDLVISYLSTHTLGANVENLTLAGSASTGIGNSGNNTILGNAGTNTIEGGLGDDVLNGGAGTDTVSYSTATAGVAVSLLSTLAQNTVNGGTDTLSNFENLQGSNFNDNLTGNIGNNVLIGGLGNDFLDGGAGTDTASYETATAGVTVNLIIVGGQNTVNAGTDTLNNFENLKGSNFNDNLTGNTGSNLIIGGLGDDVLDGGAGTDTVSYETATAGVAVNLATIGSQNTVGSGNDTLINFEYLKGSNFNDTLTGNAGNNLLIGGLGDDSLNGEAGIDLVSYETATVGVTVSLLTAIAQNTVGAGTDTLSNFESLKGSNFNDTLTGNSGNNVIIGGLGNDVMNGDAGIDTVSYSTATAGVTVNLSTVGAQNTVGAGTDQLLNFENLQGGNYNDTLTGNAGNNTLTGSLGNDTMAGNSGQDSFVFNTALNAATNNDVITDFSPVDDTLVLENAIFTQFAATGAIPAGTFVSNAGGVAGDANDFLLYDTSTGKLFYDADGNGAGAKVEFVTLVGIPALTTADFSII